MNAHPFSATIEQIRRGPFVPGRNADPDVLAVKRAHIRDPHVAPINALADRVADAEGIDRGLVPYVDPQMGGVEAAVLALLDNPSTKAEAGTGSGLLSLENDDRTARFCAEQYNRFGLAPGEVVHWNAAPAPVAGAKNGASTAAERARGARWLHDLLDLLPNLQVVLLMGRNARDGWRRSGLAPAGILIPAQVPHPSGRGMANTDAHPRLHRGLAATMTALHGPGLATPPAPSVSGHRKATSTPPRSPAAVKPASQIPASTAVNPDLTVRTGWQGDAVTSLPSPQSQPIRSDGAVWGWWPTFEHYSSTGSNPWGVSTNLKQVEAAIDRHDGPPRKMSPIARLTSTGWVLEAKRGNGRTVEMKPRQADRYINARAGGPWGNQGKVPPSSELTRPTVHLDK
ncbi:uracil-DNA glycosylase [Dietzia cinnamea]|uniref:uracil-DNA glycosylase n=1 Tax=Dietzia cinnamea TaxID=321318 RepID=UPI00223BDD90|nr:uracil-DNA glycosylase [Dietzia cinnamea]MCT2302595.1 uracil-DNA glycosylase [Dietzia cinnamea]